VAGSKKDVLQHTGIKNHHKLYLDGQLHQVNGLERTTRKRLKIEEKPHPSYYKLHPFLADRWERLSFDEYWSLKAGETVYVLEDPITIYEGVFRFASPLAACVVSICEDRPTIGHFPSIQKAGRKLQPNLSEQEIRAMPIEKILDLASNKETSRKHLEQIASVRFGVPRGGLSALRSRDALGEKIRTLVESKRDARHRGPSAWLSPVVDVVRPTATT
jgi:hypothetical protein